MVDAREIKNGMDMWSSLYKKDISQEDYKQICRNLDGFFCVLKEWDDKVLYLFINVENISVEESVQVKIKKYVDK